MNVGPGTRLMLAHNQATISLSLHLDFSAVARAVCDVTARYASHWCTHVRKQRLSEPWWAETLAPFSPSREEKEEEEEDFLGKDLSSFQRLWGIHATKHAHMHGSNYIKVVP